MNIPIQAREVLPAITTQEIHNSTMTTQMHFPRHVSIPTSEVQLVTLLGEKAKVYMKKIGLVKFLHKVQMVAFTTTVKAYMKKIGLVKFPQNIQMVAFTTKVKVYMKKIGLVKFLQKVLMEILLMKVAMLSEFQVAIPASEVLLATLSGEMEISPNTLNWQILKKTKASMKTTG